MVRMVHVAATSLSWQQWGTMRVKWKMKWYLTQCSLTPAILALPQKVRRPSPWPSQHSLDTGDCHGVSMGVLPKKSWGVWTSQPPPNEIMERHSPFWPFPPPECHWFSLILPIALSLGDTLKATCMPQPGLRMKECLGRAACCKGWEKAHKLSTPWAMWKPLAQCPEPGGFCGEPPTLVCCCLSRRVNRWEIWALFDGENKL